MRRLLLLVMCPLLLNSCGDDDGGAASEVRVDVRRTAGGFPHIYAEDWQSLGYGTGYVVAEDNLCLLARNFLKVNGELSRYLGPDDGNLDSDFFFKLLLAQGLGDDEIAPEFSELFRGYARGYNRYLQDVGGADGVADPACKGAPWVREIDEVDVARVNMTPFFLPNLIPLIVPAAPPDSSVARLSSEQRQFAALDEVLGNPHDKGSNAFAFGSELTASGRGMLIGSPHLDWVGTRRFYAMHQTVPGEFDSLGAVPVDFAFVGFGVTRHVAWSNTVSTGQRFSFFSLELEPGNPTSYIFDGEARPMTTETVTVDVLLGDGEVEQRSHTFYSTHFGILIERSDFFPWTETGAFAVRGTDDGNRGLKGGTLAASRSGSVRELQDAMDQYQYLPANLIAADSSGEVLYSEPGPVANITDQQMADCAAFAGLQGTRSECQWGDDADAAAPGILGPGNLPDLYRRDYVTNHNDSYWLTNMEEPLTGFPAVTGESIQFPGRFGEDSERTLRTRSGLDAVVSLEPGQVDVDLLQDLLLENRNFAGEMIRDDLVAICRDHPRAAVDGAAVDLSAACEVLAAWDLKANLDSRGAHVFREFMRAANDGSSSFRWLPDSLSYAVPYSSEDPIGTPRGLDHDNPGAAVEALARAVQSLNDAGIALDADLGSLQRVTRNDQVIPIHGGPEIEGVLNKVDADFDETSGYPAVTGSSASWMFISDYDERGPIVRGLLTYSLSTDPTSPYYSNQTELYSRKQWIDIPFHREDVVAEVPEGMILTE